MRIVNLEEFLRLPRGTVFAKYEPCVFGDLLIKVGNIGKTDYQYDSIGDSFDQFKLPVGEDAHEVMAADFTHVPLDFNMTGRDGLNDEKQLFAVWSSEDVCGLIARLQESLQEVSRDLRKESVDENLKSGT